MYSDELPDDLVAFLASDRRLTYDTAACEIGVFTLRDLEEVEEIDLTVSSEDHESACSIRALDLLKSCEDYDPRGILVYIPSLRKYGSYDGEGRTLITYRGMAWSDFLAKPARYINAAWYVDDEIAEATFSESAADRLVEVYSAAYGFEAHGLAAILEEKGIRTQVVGETLGIAGGGLALGQTIAPRVWVREGDAGRAREIIEQCTRQPCQERGEPVGADNQSEAEAAEDAPLAPDGEEGEAADRPEAHNRSDITFRCEECGSTVTFPHQRRGYVETCPECGNYLDVPNQSADLPPAAPAGAALPLISGKPGPPESLGLGSRTSKQLWIEVAAVLCLAYFPYLFGAITSYTGWTSANPPALYRMLVSILMSIQVAMPLLVIMALSREPWRSFGIVRPRWFADAVVTCAVYFSALAAHNFIMSLLPRSMFVGLISAHAARARPGGIAGFFLLLVAEGANGFAEELVMRAYLISRLERLLNSTSLAVVVTTALFASYHIYLGVRGMIGAAVFGFVYALAFCWFRRLWPLCIAHALWDILLRL